MKKTKISPLNLLIIFGMLEDRWRLATRLLGLPQQRGLFGLTLPKKVANHR